MQYIQTIQISLEPEKYQMIDISFKQRKALARFCCSNHKLNIELGRYFNIEWEDQICWYCFINNDIYVIEDEFHAFFQCDQFQAIRYQNLDNWYNGRRDRAAFNILMRNANFNTVKKLANYITKLVQEIDNG